MTITKHEEIAEETDAHQSAVAITEKIKETAQRFATSAYVYSEAKRDLVTLVEQARAENVHETLGMKSWTAYVVDVFGKVTLPSMDKEEQKDLVAFLWEQGMSTRAIAPIVGSTQPTVARWTKDLNAKAGEKRMGMGLDGKTRHTPKPKTSETDEGEGTSADGVKEILKRLAVLNKIDPETLDEDEWTDRMIEVHELMARLESLLLARPGSGDVAEAA